MNQPPPISSTPSNLPQPLVYPTPLLSPPLLQSPPPLLSSPLLQSPPPLLSPPAPLISLTTHLHIPVGQTVHVTNSDAKCLETCHRVEVTLTIAFNSENVPLFSIFVPYWGKIHSMRSSSDPIQLILEVLISLYYRAKINKALFVRLSKKIVNFNFFFHSFSRKVEISIPVPF